MNALHVAKRWKVEWADVTAFDHKPYEFRKLLYELGICAVGLNDESYSDFEVLKTDWEKAVYRLESVQVNHQYCPTKKSECVIDILKECNCTINDAMDLFKKYLEVAEPDDEWMHFSFF